MSFEQFINGEWPERMEQKRRSCATWITPPHMGLVLNCVAKKIKIGYLIDWKKVQ